MNVTRSNNQKEVYESHLLFYRYGKIQKVAD